MISITETSAGIVHNTHDGVAIEKIVRFLKKLNVPAATNVSRLQSFARHDDPANFELVSKALLKNVAPYFDNPGIPYLISYTEAHGTYGIHSDAAHVAPYGTPHLSLLFPLTYHPKLSTIVFNEPMAHANKVTGADFSKELEKLPDQPVDIELDGLSYQDNQCKLFRKKLSLNCKADWQLNSIIYWHANLLHSSLDHPTDLPVKKFIVMHTIE
jgi:hypothetical protein